MATYHKVGYRVAKLMAEKLSVYHIRRLAILFAEHGRPEVERQSRECPICGYVGPLQPFFGSTAMRFDAHCPRCGSRERHRFIKVWMDGDPRGADLGNMLHFAPEPELTDLLRARSTTYRTADITPGRADLELDLENVDLPDGSVDSVMANHVLEHVDDRKALSEIRRILRPGGIAVLTTPVVAAWDKSYEDAGITGETDRFRHFGQPDHLRYFGRDIEDRIRSAGLDLELVVADGASAARYGLIPGDTIFLASRPAA